MNRWLGALLMSCMTACTVDLPQGRFACDTDLECPGDWSCVSGRCYAARVDAEIDARNDMDGALDSAIDSSAMVDSGVDANLDATDRHDADHHDANVDDGSMAMHDGGDVCLDGFERRGNACMDINECARPVAAAPTTFTALQADTSTQAAANDLLVSNAWVKLSGNFRVGLWEDQSDLCGADDFARDAFFQIRTTRTTTLQLRARGEVDTRVVLAVFPTDAATFTLPERARDAAGERVPCLSGQLELTQVITLSAGEYLVVVKAHARCDLDVTTCVLDGNATQDDAFSLEIRDLDLPTFPCDSEPLASCSNTQGGFTCRCPDGSDGSGEGPNGCL